MTSNHIVAGSIDPSLDFPANRRLSVIRDAAGKMFYFTTIVIVFAFVLVLTIGPHP
jgi:hypothetical protein